MGTMSVTQIISELYPFTQQNIWIDSLNKELASYGKSPVQYDDVMKITQVVGDIIHTYFIEVAMGFPTVGLPEIFQDLEEPIRAYIASNNVKGLICEFHIEKPGEYIGHPDLIVMKDYLWKRIKALCDVKTYGLYRKVLGLPEKVAWKLNGNTSKVSLQTSMYRDALLFSKMDHIQRHWNVTHLFCYHIKYDSVDAVELKFDVSKYLAWKNKAPNGQPMVDYTKNNRRETMWEASGFEQSVEY